jgi:dienelactone hydrolase
MALDASHASAWRSGAGATGRFEQRRLHVLKYSAALFSAGLLWATSARAEDVYVTVPWKDEQIQIRARLFRPAGPGPFPGVILLHACEGLNGYVPIGFYTSMLVQQGYAVAQPDSFTARHIVEDCNKGAVKALDRAQDVFAVAELMATRPDIRASKIGVVGWSHGGNTAVYVARDWPKERPLRESLAAKGAKIAASVAFYGETCGDAEKAAVVLPLLGLFGERDNNTRIDVCQALTAPSNGLMQIHVYENDYHGFDAGVSGPDPSRPFSPPGARVIIFNDPVAAQDSHARVLAFFAEHLK